MHLALTVRQRQLRAELGSYFREVMEGAAREEYAADPHDAGHAAIGMQAEDCYDQVPAYAATPDPATGERLVDRPWVRARLAEAYARLAAVRLLNWRLVGDVGAGTLAPGDASGVKFMGTESVVAVYRICQEVAGEAGMVCSGSVGARGDGGRRR